jgi:hypothetical protein
MSVVLKGNTINASYYRMGIGTFVDVEFYGWVLRGECGKTGEEELSRLDSGRVIPHAL